MLRPPTHRADAPPVVFLRTDPGLAHARIAAERAALHGAPHPIDRFLGGETRYDLAAVIRCDVLGEVSILDYVGDATLFRLRRLPREVYEQVRSALSANTAHQLCKLGVGDTGQLIGALSFDRARTVDAWAAACRAWLVSIERSPIPWPLAEGVDVCDALHEVDPSIVEAVGVAAFMASSPLRADESLRYA
jgi:hypothetical protein